MKKCAKKAAFALFLLCPHLIHPMAHRLNSWLDAHPAQAGVLMLAGATGTIIAGVKGFQLARFHYLALSPLKTLNERADACAQAVEASLGDELKNMQDASSKRAQADFLTTLRNKYQQKGSPLLYFHQMIRMMQSDVQENKDLLDYKLRAHDELNEMIKAEKLKDQLNTLADQLSNLKTFLENTYEYKAELENRRSLELMLASRRTAFNC